MQFIWQMFRLTPGWFAEIFSVGSVGILLAPIRLDVRITLNKDLVS